MKVNLKVRMKNPWFWVSLLGVIATAVGIRPELLTSWGALAQALRELLGNPYLLGSAVLAALGVFVDPTTKGLSDSAQAMTYEKPKEEGK